MPLNSPPIPGQPSSIPGIPSIIPGLPSAIPGAPSQIGFGEMGLGSLSGGGGVAWEGLLQLTTNMNKYGTAVDKHRVIVIDKIAQDMEAWAQQNAPWSDQTGNARAGLQGSAQHDEDRHISTASIAHGVDYGVYLETRFGGRFAIILPTVLQFAGRLAEYEVPAVEEAYMSGGVAVAASDVRTNAIGRLINSRTGRFVRRVLGR